jgi:hypothetical protein
MTWRKSSYSGSNGNSGCIEVAFGAAVGVRDSKNVEGPRLAFEADQWHAFLARVTP